MTHRTCTHARTSTARAACRRERAAAHTDDMRWVLDTYGDLVDRQVLFYGLDFDGELDDLRHYGNVISVGVDDRGHPQAVVFDLAVYHNVNVCPSELEIVPEDKRKAY